MAFAVPVRIRSNLECGCFALPDRRDQDAGPFGSALMTIQSLKAARYTPEITVNLVRRWTNEYWQHRILLGSGHARCRAAAERDHRCCAFQTSTIPIYEFCLLIAHQQHVDSIRRLYMSDAWSPWIIYVVRTNCFANVCSWRKPCCFIV